MTVMRSASRSESDVFEISTTGKSGSGWDLGEDIGSWMSIDMISTSPFGGLLSLIWSVATAGSGGASSSTSIASSIWFVVCDVFVSRELMSL